MYEVARKDNEVIIYRNEHAIYSAKLDSFVVHRDSSGQLKISKVKDLTDEALLKALAEAVEIEKGLGR